MIDFNTFRALYAEAKNYDSEGKYIMERGWQEWMNGLDDADEIANMLRKIYSMANGGFAEIVSQYKNMKQMCNFFGIPYSTAQKWSIEERNPSDYVLLLLAYATINIDKMHKSE